MTVPKADLIDPPDADPPQNTGHAAQAEMLGNRLRKNAAHRAKWARRAGVTCYRLYERDIPEIPLIVDWYEGRVHVAERARPNTDAMDLAEHGAWLGSMLGAIAGALSVDVGSIAVKRRQRQKGSAQYTTFATTGERFVVHEGAAQLWVNLHDYLDTGLFLDHRPLRARVGAEAAGKRVLNLFCYTGAFTVHAALGGAASTTSVDLSSTYIDWARDNLALNGLRGPANRLVRAEIATWLRDPVVAADQYDLCVVDPPTFSNSARMEGVFDVQRDHVELLDRVRRILAPGGVIYFSSNFHRFKPAWEAGLLPGLEATEITGETIPEDFRGTKIHRAWRLVAAASKRVSVTQAERNGVRR